MSLLRSAKTKYYRNFRRKKVIDNKQFWKTIKPPSSDKSVSRDRLNLIAKDEIVKSESETAKSLNKLFSNIVKNLGIPVYDDFDPIIENMKDPVYKAILKYKNHPSILEIKDIRENSIFCFKEITIEGIEKKITWAAKKPLKIVIFQQQLLKKMQIFLQTLCKKNQCCVQIINISQFFETGWYHTLTQRRQKRFKRKL